MPDITISDNNKSFDIKIRSEEMSLYQQGSGRLPVCFVRYPKPTQGLNILDETVDNGLLGVLKLQKELVAQNNILRGDVGPFDVTNNLSLDVKFNFYEESTFDPCILDRNGDGLISANDVSSLYQNMPFIDPSLDVNNDGIVDDADFLLAREYIGEYCFDEEGGSGEEAGSGNEPSVSLELDLDCFLYEDGSGVWSDASGKENDFFIETGGTSAPPIVQPDGSVTVGYGAFIGGDELSTRRSFVRDCVTVPELPEGQELTEEDVIADSYIPRRDEDFSYEFIFKYTAYYNHGQEVAGMVAGPPEAESARRCKMFGYSGHGQEGFNFGTFYSPESYAFDPSIFIPYHGIEAQVYKGGGPFEGEYSEESVNDQFQGARPMALGFFGLTQDNGLSFGTQKVCVQFVHSSVDQVCKMYVNGILAEDGNTNNITIGFPSNNRVFKIGWSMQGGWSSPDGIDVYMLRVYKGFLSDEQLEANFGAYKSKYGI